MLSIMLFWLMSWENCFEFVEEGVQLYTNVLCLLLLLPFNTCEYEVLVRILC